MKSFKDQLLALGDDILREGGGGGVSYADKEYEQMEQYVEQWLAQDMPEEKMAEELDAKFGVGSSRYLSSILRKVQGLDEEASGIGYTMFLDRILEIIRTKYSSTTFTVNNIPGFTIDLAKKINAKELKLLGIGGIEDLIINITKVLANEGRVDTSIKIPPNYPANEIIINRLRDIKEDVQLDEDYEDRVRMIVDLIKNKHGTLDKDEVDMRIKIAAQEINAPESKMPHLLKDLLIDVKQVLSKEGLIRRNKSKPARTSNGIPVEVLDQLAMAITRYSGEVFPDGDPIDYLIPWMRKHGIHEHSFSTALDKAAKLLGAKSYNDYLADFYDQFTGDNPGVMDLDPKQNPWRAESADEGEKVDESIGNLNSIALQYEADVDKYSLNDILIEIEKEVNNIAFDRIAFDSGDRTIFFLDKVDDRYFDELARALERKGIVTRKINNAQPSSPAWSPTDEGVADPHGGSMISPYDDEPSDAALDRALQIIQDQALEILKYDYSDVLTSKEAFLQAYNLEDIDGLAHEIAHDAIASSKGAFDDDEIVYAVNSDQVKDTVVSAIRRAIGITEDREYYMQETLNRIQNLAGIRK